jgi:hypothetical protein
MVKRKLNKLMERLVTNICSSQVNRSMIVSCLEKPLLQSVSQSESSSDLRYPPPLINNNNNTSSNETSLGQLPMLLTTPELKKQKQTAFSSSVIAEQQELLMFEFSEIKQLNTQLFDSQLDEDWDEEQTIDVLFANKLYESPASLVAPVKNDDQEDETTIRLSQLDVESFGFQSGDFQSANSQFFHSIADQEIFV